MKYPTEDMGARKLNILPKFSYTQGF